MDSNCKRRCYEQHQPHTSLLAKMTEINENSSNVMKGVIAALNHVEAELGCTPQLSGNSWIDLKGQSLDVIIAPWKKAGQQLKASKAKLEHVDGGGIQGNYMLKASMRTVVVTLA